MMIMTDFKAMATYLGRGWNTGNMKIEMAVCRRCAMHNEKGWTFKKQKEFAKNWCSCEGLMNYPTLTFDFTWEEMYSVMLEAETLIRGGDGYGHGYFNLLWDKRNKDETQKVLLEHGTDWPLWYNWVGDGVRGMIFYIKFFGIVRRLLAIKRVKEDITYYYNGWQSEIIRENKYHHPMLREANWIHLIHYTKYLDELKAELANYVELVSGEPWYYKHIYALHLDPDGD
jgi:hypothetical protein